MRSWLFTPGHDRRKLSKALASDADVVIVDWEDGVPADQRSLAHEVAFELLVGSTSRRYVIRTSAGAEPAFSDDIRVIEQLLIKGVPVRGVVIPKVESVGQVQPAARLGLPIIASIESARALDRLSNLAAGLASNLSIAGFKLERLALG